MDLWTDAVRDAPESSFGLERAAYNDYGSEYYLVDIIYIFGSFRGSVGDVFHRMPLITSQIFLDKM